ncbi:phosphate ABC transporter substrate-binding protein PstS family protein [Haloarcula mannanilytica]|nr:phosphate ABC transporter substrate-binding protein PstS family protein [Haloarcula mannanilytica]
MTDSPTGGLSRRRFLAGSGSLGALALAGCVQNTRRDGDGSDSSGSDGGSGSDGSSGQVIIKGSSTVFPISDTMAEEFMSEHDGVNVTVDSTGSGGGFKNWFCPGDSDINGASRPITDGEIEQCSSNNVEPVEFEIAGDALTVAVNNDADWVDCLTFEELRQIWSEGGVTNWSDVRDEWPDMEIERYGPASTSGTFDYFNENVVGEDTKHTTEYQPTEEDETIVQGIRDNKGGMGYFGFAYYKSNSEAVKAVEIKNGDGGECTPPSLANAKDGSYPLARPLYIYVAESALQDESVYEFVKFYLEQAETDVVQEIGYVPSSPEQRDKNLEKLAEIAG